MTKKNITNTPTINEFSIYVNSGIVKNDKEKISENINLISVMDSILKKIQIRDTNKKVLAILNPSKRLCWKPFLTHLFIAISK
jgi:hypothetical protein